MSLITNPGSVECFETFCDLDLADVLLSSREGGRLVG